MYVALLRLIIAIKKLYPVHVNASHIRIREIASYKFVYDALKI